MKAAGTSATTALEPMAKPHIASAQTKTPAKSLGEDVLQRIGNTPLLRLERVTRASAPAKCPQILAKAEWFNPGGSIKDRVAASIVLEAERSGSLLPGMSLLDSTSSNTGIAYAMIGAPKGFPVTLCMPTNVSVERKHILHAYGA